MTNMLACVCQPTDAGIFGGRPQVPAGSVVVGGGGGAIPKRGSRGVITREPNPKGRITNITMATQPRKSNVTVELAGRRQQPLLSQRPKAFGKSNLSQFSSPPLSSSSSESSLNRESPSTAKIRFRRDLSSKVVDSPKKVSSYGESSLERCRKSRPITSPPLSSSSSSVSSRRSAESRDSKPVDMVVVVESDKPSRHHHLLRISTLVESSFSSTEKLPEGVQLTLNELRDMACRQQAQIDSQHQLLAAKEQRLRYLKDQEARQQRVQAETERLRRLRDRVDAQELKLRKLRALRGQVDHHKQNNISLTSDLESIRALFNEKEKELSLAVAKVEELTRQLEELRRGGRNRDHQIPPAASALELDKLRRELMYRNKLNEQQNQKLNQQREALTARQEEMSSIDKRISELQERLHRKRILNQQLATQISAASNKAAYHQLVRLTTTTTTQGSAVDQTTNNQFYGSRKQQQQHHQQQQMINAMSRGNIATVEPYNHVPLPNGHGHPKHIGSNQENLTYHPVYQQQNQHIITNKNDLEHLDDPNKVSNHHQYQPNRTDENEALKEFSVSKSDPKYQTLPYNTKFTVNHASSRVNNRLLTENGDNNNGVHNSETKDNNNVNNSNNNNGASEPLHHISANSYHMTAHSAPLNIASKIMATPLGQGDVIVNRKGIIDQAMTNCKEQINGNAGEALGKHQADPGGHHPGIHQYQKPISSVAPTSVHHSGKLSNIYQTSSIKVQPVEPQTVTSKQLPVITANTTTIVQSPQDLTLSPPQANSTPVSTPETSASDKSRPALPPKPAIKPPPRQTPASCDSVSSPDHHHLSEQPPTDDVPTTLSSLSVTSHRAVPQPPSIKTSFGNHMSKSNLIATSSNEPIIKAKPLTIKKQPLGEQPPKLRNFVNSKVQLNGAMSLATTGRRVEIPAAFHQFGGQVSSSEPVDKPSSRESSPPSSDVSKEKDEIDRVVVAKTSEEAPQLEESSKTIDVGSVVVLRRGKKGNLKHHQQQQASTKTSSATTGTSSTTTSSNHQNLSRRVSFDPLALLLDASLEGELELVKKTAGQVPNPSAANDEGITALHNAICAGHFEIVKFLVEFGCDVNAQDSDGWTPLHCAASCNNVSMVKFLVEHGACIFATTLSDHETAAEKCEEDEEGFDGCSEYLYSVQEKLGILSGGAVFAVFDYQAQQSDELSFRAGQQLTVLRKGDENEREWWWSRLDDREGYVPRNLLGLYSRVSPKED